MSTVTYCYDARAELICTALINTEEPDKRVQFFWGEEVYTYLKKWMPTKIVAHRAMFDVLFLKARFPDLPWTKCSFVCTMYMAQSLYHAAIPRPILNLDTLSKKLLNATGKTLNVKQFDGMHRDDIAADGTLYMEMRQYVEQDVWLCFQLAKYLKPRVSDMPMLVIRWALHQFINPKTTLDIDKVHELHSELEVKRINLLAKVNSTPEVMRSRPKFKALLEERGYTVPTKPSPSDRSKQIPQLAKTDDFILNNQEAKTELGDLIRCRIAYSSNLEITRCESWIHQFNLSPYYYYSVTPSGTFTHRLTGSSGGGGNPLNLPRKSLLRKAIKPASKKWMFAGFDLSGLELRIARWVANDTPAINAVLNGEDLYVNFIAQAIGMPVDELMHQCAIEDPEADRLRFIGKQCQLGCQYGVSGQKLYIMLKQFGVDVTLEECSDYVQVFRKRAHKALPAAWRTFETILMRTELDIENPLYSADDVRRLINMPGQRLLGGGWVWPSGTVLRFPKLTSYRETNNFLKYNYQPAYPIDKTTKPIYGSAFFQAHIQSLANEVISDIRLRLMKEKFDVAMECYDELTLIVPRMSLSEQEATAERVQSIAEAKLTWWDNSPPLEAEVKLGENYYEMK